MKILNMYAWVGQLLDTCTQWFFLLCASLPSGRGMECNRVPENYMSSICVI